MAKNMSADPLESALPTVLPNQIIDCCSRESFGFVADLPTQEQGIVSSAVMSDQSGQERLCIVGGNFSKMRWGTVHARRWFGLKRI